MNKNKRGENGRFQPAGDRKKKKIPVKYDGPVQDEHVPVFCEYCGCDDGHGEFCPRVGDPTFTLDDVKPDLIPPIGINRKAKGEKWARNMQDRMDANLLKNGMDPIYTREEMAKLPKPGPAINTDFMADRTTYGKEADPYFPIGKAKQAFETWAKQGRSKEQQWAVMNFLTGAGRVLWFEDKPQFSTWTAKIAEPGELARVMRKFERRHKDAIRMLWILGIGILLLIVEVVIL